METDVIGAMAQYLTFKLEDEIFAVDVINIREILDYTTPTKVPGSPDYMSGVINVRGSVIPVVDMRLKFGLSSVEQTQDTCIVVTEVNLEAENTIVGALVDSVEEVFELDTGLIEKPPKLGMRWKREFLKGISHKNENLLIILDIDKVFGSGDLPLIEETIEE